MKNEPELRFPEFEDDWEEKILGELAEIVRGSSPRPISDPRWFDEASDIGWLRISDVTEQNGKIYNLEQRISEEGQQKTRVLRSQHLLLSIAASVGKPVMNYVNTGVHDGFLIFLNPSFKVEFMFYWLDEFKDKWQRYGQPGSQVNLNSSLVKSQKLYIPRIDEQNKISDFFSKLDRQIELEEQKLEKLEEQKKGYMQKIFSQELRFKNENGNNYPDWEVKKIGEIMDVASVKRIHQSDWTNEGVKFIRARDIVSRYKGKIVEDPLFISKERYEEYSKLSGKVKIGDLLVTGVGTIGVPLLINNEKPIYFKDGNIIWLKNEDNIDKNFLFYSFISRKTQNFIKRVAGIGTVGTYTISNAKKTPILLPVSIEQVKIGNFFNELDKSIKKQNKKVDLLKERKKGFLQKMFI
ncbi:restriction endonuclease subunit S [Staphylococcus cohnii]|uniref:restriction endonuclease subunit S n=1 Tax=Staphylococcus cohnii TaxID=29382 RepID=UPI0036C0C345